MLRHHPLRSGASSSVFYHHLCSREGPQLTLWGQPWPEDGAASPYLYDGCQAGQRGRDLQPGCFQGCGIHVDLVGSVVEVLEVRLWSQLMADVANNYADDCKSTYSTTRCCQQVALESILPWKALGQVGLSRLSHPAHHHSQPCSGMRQQFLGVRSCCGARISDPINP